MHTIKFGTDGWRAIIAREYTVDNVMRVAEGTARWMKKRNMTQAVIGFDCRFGGRMFTEASACVLAAHGIKVLMAPEFVSTPMVSLGVVKTGSDIGVVITASHNPPSYNGFKLKSSLGGPMIQQEVDEVEGEIPDACSVDARSLDVWVKEGQIVFVDLEQLYLDHVAANFDLPAIHAAGISLAYDAMYGAGQRAMQKLFPNAALLHCDENPGFHGQAPEPIHKNLQELSQFIRDNPDIQLGIANDGDADRIGLYDADGNFVDSHHILLLLLLYMVRYKGETGKVVVTFSVTEKMSKLAASFGLPVEITKIGFKYIAEIMGKEDVVVGGEESGGLAVKGHIPERDGIWIGLMIMEFMAKTGKSLQALIEEVYALVGPFAFDRDDLHMKEEQKQAIIRTCRENPYAHFGAYSVERLETVDGFKFILDENRWILIRPSGTEPVLRVYAQAPDHQEVRRILDAVGQTFAL